MFKINAFLDFKPARQVQAFTGPYDITSQKP
jgi:hypothetical protein